MEVEDALTKVLSNTFTKSDCYKRFLSLEDFITKERFKVAEKQGSLSERLLASKTLASEQAAAIAVWGEDFLVFANDVDGTSLRELKKRIESLPELVLYSPVIFDTPQIEAIGSWCRKNVDPKVLLDLRVDKSATGGCIMVWNHVLYDFSLDYFMRKYQPQVSKMISDTLLSQPAKELAA